jgi:hypothetical protein
MRHNPPSFAKTALRPLALALLLAATGAPADRPVWVPTREWAEDRDRLPATDHQLACLNDALVELFLPDGLGPLSPTQAEALARVRDFSWYALKGMPRVVALLQDFQRYNVGQRERGPGGRWLRFSRTSFPDLPLREREAYLRRMGA